MSLDDEAARRAAGDAHRAHGARREELDFFFSVAHELNNVVVPLQFNVQFLAAQGDAGPTLSAVREATRRLAGLAADILEATRARSGRLQLRHEPFDLQELARDVWTEFATMATAQRVRLEMNPRPPCPVIADRERLRQAIVNLVSNALKATPAGGRVGMEVHNRGGEALVRVADSGRGFSPEARERMFSPFSPGGPEGRHTGTGLGLCISRDLVAAHGGRMDCSSPGPGKGATFWFEVPSIPASPAGAPAMREQAVPGDPAGCAA